MLSAGHNLETINWCEIGPKKVVRFEILSKFLTSQGIKNEFTFLESSSENLEEVISQAKKDRKFIRFHPDLFDKVSGHLDNTFRDFKLLNSTDSLIFEESGQYWPDIVMRESLFEFLVHKVKALDVSQKVFCIGTCGMSRSVLSALIKLGFSKFAITGGSAEEASQLIADFGKIYFNVSMEYVQRSDVTILPGTHGMVVNTLSALDTDDFPNEIYYFNFLKKGGLVLDLVDLPTETPFLKIAADIGAQAISGYEALGFYDMVWLEKVIGKRLSSDLYINTLKTELENVEYNKEKIQKILQEFQL